MHYTQHPTNNAVYGAPVGWDQADLPVGALPATITDIGIASFWKPTAEELDALNKGALVVLHVIGQTMVPVSIGVTPE